MANSTSKNTKPKPPKKPHPNFPLYAHVGGKWAKKVRNRVHYFTKWSQDPKGQFALEQWIDEKDDLLAGRKPRRKAKPEDLTVRDLANHFLTHKDGKRERGDLSKRSFVDYVSTCEEMIRVFGRTRVVEDLSIEDFAELRESASKRLGKVALGNFIQRVRTVFNFAKKQRLIRYEMTFGVDFAKPPAKSIRRERNVARRAGFIRMWNPQEIRLMIRYLAGDKVKVGESEIRRTKPQLALRAMILLAANGGFGNTDLSTLPLNAIDLESGWVDYPRPKTEVDRRVPLWDETIEAIRDYLAQRPEPKENKDLELLFLTVRGSRFIKISDVRVEAGKRKGGTVTDGIGQEFRKLTLALKINRSRVGFYGFRHGFETIGGGSKDQIAVNYIMGHVDETIASAYREGLDDQRLRDVVDHVHAWLFPKS
ncbi:site-specific tyrosine recombinase XerC [Calycomorphotria hydatis]|uniref:Site-specific tyrosine recombinase XerC n=2 Tax=Calycomorphotria hydatis TaxID=2528027 RepID=A0A517TDC0_9PLAN|nr:site-specific tyrosine recombinase XerC [Calycomorphotria hydatis]